MGFRGISWELMEKGGFRRILLGRGAGGGEFEWFL
jgi:hypothetical protein